MRSGTEIAAPVGEHSPRNREKDVGYLSTKFVVKHLQPYIDCLREVLNADQATLLLYSGASNDRQAQLFSSGSAAPVPEFANLEAAEHLINGALRSRKVEVFASTDNHCRLICIPFAEAPEQTPEQANERRAHQVSEPGFWVGLRGGIDDSELAQQFGWLATSTRLAAQVFALRSWRADPDTGLPDRGEYERALEQYLAVNNAANRDAEVPVSVLLIAPKVSTREQQSEHLVQACRRAQSVLRDSDQLYRYNDATLALPLLGVDEAGLKALCQKLQQTFAATQASTEDTRWAIAAVHFESGESERLRTIDCARLADFTLRRCLVQSGSRIQVHTGSSAEGAGAPEPLQGIFTADPVRDYRNMQLLWEALEQLGNATSAAELGVDIVTLVSAALDAPVSLLTLAEANSSPSSQPVQVLSSCGNLPADDAALDRLAKDAVASDCSVKEQIAGVLCHAFPAQQAPSPALVLVVADRALDIAEPDERLLENLAKQTATSMTRLQYREQESQLRETEAKTLRAQVTALSQGAAPPQPVFRSPRMQAVVAQAELWAATHETLLISGESGAGKEIMASRLHQQSLRADAPMVTVDCAAIPATLLEAELFGRVKGAYTGADSASEGYVRKAQGGTLFLDEIGELPVDIQSKLLRFVQEKQISPVGSTDLQRIDVRIIAATNRDLATEVAAGRFRADLMYRLQVLEIRLPPLRERPEDIDSLAQLFLDSYNQQYERDCQLTDAARDHLRSYPWPGNVRELKHSMLKACLECSNNQIEPSDIGFSQPLLSRPTAPGERVPADASAAASKLQNPHPHSAPQTAASLWQDLEQSLRECCQAAVDGELRLPIGTWVMEALIRAANERAAGVAKHGATLLQLPESTYRRQLDRIRQTDQTGLAVLHPLFQPSISLIDGWLAATVTEQPDAEQRPCLVDQVRALLLGIVAELLPDQPSFGAALMGVTAPTYRRHLQAQRLPETGPAKAC